MESVLYSKSEVYDLAFNYRDYEEECNFLLNNFFNINKLQAKSFLELAGGPSRHAICMSKKGLSSSTIDLSKSMCEYAKKISKSEGFEINVYNQNMVDFHLDQKFNLIANMIDSISYIHSPYDLVKHFRSVENHLKKDGLYFVELSHPSGVFAESGGENVLDKWSSENKKMSVDFKWGSDNDSFDPVTLVSLKKVEANISTNSGTNKIISYEKNKLHFIQELILASIACESMQYVGSYGGFKGEDINGDDAWRTLSFFQKIRSAKT